MIDTFTHLYSSIKDNNTFLSRVRFYSLERVIVRVIANIVLPIYLRITASKEEYRLTTSTDENEKIIVSLTSFPARISRVWIVIESMLRQTYPPDKIILWLSKEQFTGLDSVPKELSRLQKRGLEINLCSEDLRSHKKYYYSVMNYPNDILITVDDDVMYPSNFIKNLMNYYERYPNAVCCNRAVLITSEEEKILPYKEWLSIDTEKGPVYNILPTGVGGVLYPPGSLHNEVLNKEVFMKYCKYADDVWLNIMSKMNGTKTIKTDKNVELMPIINKNDSTLYSFNVQENQNDRQIEDVRNYYINKNNIDPFQKVLNGKKKIRIMIPNYLSNK